MNFLHTFGTISPPRSTDRFIVGDYQLQRVRPLAEGGFGAVILVRDERTGKHFALKKLSLFDEDRRSSTEREIDILRTSKHKNIVEYFGHQFVKAENGIDEALILLEYLPGHSLVDMMYHKEKLLPEAELLQIFSDVCEAVCYLHSHEPPIAHRDLKIENVLRAENGSYKLFDFGSATTKSLTPQTIQEITVLEDEIQRVTTLSYRSPEIVDLYQRKHISEKVDVWALGCLLYKLAFKDNAFEDNKLQIVNCKYSIPPNPFSDNISQLIRWMLDSDPDTRPEAFEVLDRVMKLRSLPPLYAGRPKKIRAEKQPPPQPTQAEVVKVKKPGSAIYSTTHVNPCIPQQQTNYKHRRNKSVPQQTNDNVATSSPVPERANFGNSLQPESFFPAQQAPLHLPIPLTTTQMPMQSQLPHQLQFPQPPIIQSPLSPLSPVMPPVQLGTWSISTGVAEVVDTSTNLSTSTLKNIVTGSWERETCQQLFSALVQFTNLSSLDSIYKAIILIHKLYHEGSPQVIAETWSKIEWLKELKNAAAKLDDGQLKEAETYAEVLIKKTMFHHKYPEYEGNISPEFHIKKVLEAGQSPKLDSGPLSEEAVLNQIDLLDSARSCGEVLLSNLKQTNSYRIGALFSCTQEGFLNALASTFLLEKLHASNTKMESQTTENYRKSFSSLLSFFSSIHSSHPDFPLPALPPSIPEFSHTGSGMKIRPPPSNIIKHQQYQQTARQPFSPPSFQPFVFHEGESGGTPIGNPHHPPPSFVPHHQSSFSQSSFSTNTTFSPSTPSTGSVSDQSSLTPATFSVSSPPMSPSRKFTPKLSVSTYSQPPVISTSSSFTSQSSSPLSPSAPSLPGLVAVSPALRSVASSGRSSSASSLTRPAPKATATTSLPLGTPSPSFNSGISPPPPSPSISPSPSSPSISPSPSIHFTPFPPLDGNVTALPKHMATLKLDLNQIPTGGSSGNNSPTHAPANLFDPSIKHSSSSTSAPSLPVVPPSPTGAPPTSSFMLARPTTISGATPTSVTPRAPTTRVEGGGGSGSGIRRIPPPLAPRPGTSASGLGQPKSDRSHETRNKSSDQTSAAPRSPPSSPSSLSSMPAAPPPSPSQEKGHKKSKSLAVFGTDFFAFTKKKKDKK